MPLCRSRRTIGLFLTVLAPLAGCAGKTAATAPPATASRDVDEAAVSDVMEHHRHHHHGGVLMLIAMSLDTLGLSPEEQARVEKLRSELMAKMQPARLAERNVVAALADSVAASSADRSKVDAALAELDAAAAALHDSALDELNQLHALLTPAQRAALVDKVEAHWTLWKQANTGRQHGHVAAIAKELGLTQEQMEQVHKALASTDAASPLRERDVEAHLDDFGKAFRADAFDAKTLARAKEVNRHLAGWGSARLVRFCEAVNPLLTSEQRDKLVALLREHLNHGEERAKE